jgi:glycosyltransferase involved in cell wall biosynthesis
MTKVCVVNPNYYRSSGVTVAIRRIYESLSDADVTQYFVHCAYGPQEDDTAWIPQHRLAVFKLMNLNPAVFVPECVRFLGWLKANDIRVVHVHHRRLAAILNLLKTCGVYELIYTGNLTYPFELWFWLTCPEIVTGISESVLENMRRTTRATNLHFISNGCDFPLECPVFDVERVKANAICIARLDPVKGHENLLSAWRLLLDRGHRCRLLLVGEGALRQTLERRAKDLGIYGYVEFRGFQKDVVPLIEEASFAVLASKVEGQGIVTIEAAARGRASLVTDVDGSRDCVPPGRTLPNLVRFGDVTGLADALAAWFSRPDEVSKEGRLFFDYLKRSSATAIVGEKYRALYAQVETRSKLGTRS